MLNFLKLFRAFATRFFLFRRRQSRRRKHKKSSDRPLNGKFVLRNIDYYFS